MVQTKTTQTLSSLARSTRSQLARGGRPPPSSACHHAILPPTAGLNVGACRGWGWIGSDGARVASRSYVLELTAMPPRGRRQGYRGATFSMSQGYHHHPNCHSAAHHSTPPPKQRRPLRHRGTAGARQEDDRVRGRAKQAREAGRPPRRRGEPAMLTDTGEAAAVSRPAHRSPSGGEASPWAGAIKATARDLAPTT